MHKLMTTLGALALGLGLSAPALADAEADMAKAGCNACHTKDKKLVGPSYKEIAAKNKGQKDAEKMLAETITKGSKGKYGKIPMPPQPKAAADASALAKWILTN